MSLVKRILNRLRGEFFTINRLLPAEMVAMVLQLLPPRDLMAAMLVCRRWREVGEDSPALWTWVWLKVNYENHASLYKMIDSRRILMATNMRVGNYLVSDEGLQAVVRRLKLKSLEMETNSSSEDTKLMGTILSSLESNTLESLCLHAYSLNTEEATQLLTALQNISSLKSLNLSYINLSEVDPGLLARAVTRVELVYMDYSQIQAAQAEAIFATIQDGGKLKKLMMRGTYEGKLSTVNQEVMAKGINLMEEVEIQKSTTSGEQVTRVLTQALKGTQLKSLGMMGEVVEIEAKHVRLARRVMTELSCNFDVVFHDDTEWFELKDWATHRLAFT